MPCCFDHAHAKRWQIKAGDSERKNKGVIVRMRVDRIDRHNLIDVSNKRAQNHFFQNDRHGWGDYVRDGCGYLGRSILNGELLIMWRGRLSIHDMEVVDEDRGDFVLTYEDHLRWVYKKKRFGPENAWRLVESAPL